VWFGWRAKYPSKAVRAAPDHCPQGQAGPRMSGVAGDQQQGDGSQRALPAECSSPPTCGTASAVPSGRETWPIAADIAGQAARKHTSPVVGGIEGGRRWVGRARRTGRVRNRSKRDALHHAGGKTYYLKTGRPPRAPERKGRYLLAATFSDKNVHGRSTNARQRQAAPEHPEEGQGEVREQGTPAFPPRGSKPLGNLGVPTVGSG